jgi:hypothetical protein
LVLLEQVTVLSQAAQWHTEPFAVENKLVHPIAELSSPRPLNVLPQDDRVLTRQLASRISPFRRCPSLRICDMIPTICIFVCCYCPAFLSRTLVTISLRYVPRPLLLRPDRLSIPAPSSILHFSFRVRNHQEISESDSVSPLRSQRHLCRLGSHKGRFPAN